MAGEALRRSDIERKYLIANIRRDIRHIREEGNDTIAKTLEKMLAIVEKLSTQVS